MLSQEFLIDRGYCCGHGCLMWPYEPKHIKDNTIMAEQWTGKGSNSRVKDKQQYDDNYDKIFKSSKDTKFPFIFSMAYNSVFCFEYK